MAVPAGPTEQRYVGNGVSTIFTVPFLVIQASDLAVYVDGVKLTSGYSQSGVGNPTSTVVFSAAPALNAQILLALEVPFERLNDYQENGDFLSSTVNRDFDRLWQALKQLLRYSDRSLRLEKFDVDGQGWYRGKGNGIRDLHDPVLNQDAATLGWTTQFVSNLLAQVTGPVNNAANIFYQYPDGTPHVVQDLARLADGADGIGWDGRKLSATLKTIRSTDLSGNADKAQALIDFAASLNGQRGRVEPGTYTMTKQVNLPGNVDLDLTSVTLDFSAANVANFPDLICLRPAPGTLFQLPALSADTVIGTYSITFSAAHNLAPGDAIILHDDKPSSYSAFRTNYYQGQFAVVRSASGLTVNLTAPILASMSIVLDGNGKGLKIYKMNPTCPKIRGGTILMPTTGVLIAGLLTDITRNAQVEYTRVFGTSGGGIIHQRALGATSLFCESYSDRDSAAADNYGLGLSNSHHCLVSGGTFHARRHGVTMGGADIPGGVPTRFCVVESAETSSWDVQGSDMHGNVEHCQYVNCIHRNGITIGGNHNSIRGGTVLAPALSSTGNGVAISINEMRGTSFLFEGFKIIADGDPQTTSRGVIDCGGNSNSMTADTILGGCMTFRDIDIDAPNARIPIKIVNRGSTATGKSVDIKIKCPNSPATRTSNGIVQNISGTTFNSVRFEADFPNDGAPAGTTLDASRVRGMRESGTTSTTTDAATFKDVPITFNRRFPKAPSMRLNGNLSAAGVNIFYTPISVNTNGATLRIYTTGANMTAGVAVNLMWEAVLDE